MTPYLSSEISRSQRFARGESITPNPHSTLVSMVIGKTSLVKEDGRNTILCLLRIDLKMRKIWIIWFNPFALYTTKFKILIGKSKKGKLGSQAGGICKLWLILKFAVSQLVMGFLYQSFIEVNKVCKGSVGAPASITPQLIKTQQR